jgi:RNA polymerase sigma factor (sigma-70 family)
MPAPPTDESLMFSYRDGDMQAFRELYDRHSQGLYLFIAWRSPRRDWVDEIVQDTWASLHQARSRYQPQAAFRTYLFQIARNKLIDQLRQNRRTVLASEWGNDADDGGIERLLDSSSDTPSPENLLEMNQQTQILHAAIRTLPSEQREALVLQQFNGMSLDEIAELVNAPVETVKSRLRYAMKKLRLQFGQPRVPDVNLQGEKA